MIKHKIRPLAIIKTSFYL